MAVDSLEVEYVHKNGGVVSISSELFREILGIDPSVQIKGLEYRWDRETWDIYLCAPAIQVTSFAPASSLVVGMGQNFGATKKAWVSMKHRGFGGEFTLYPVQEGELYPYTNVRLTAINHRRRRVYEAIDSEREYQDQKWGNPRHDEQESMGNFLIYIERYLNRAKAGFYDHNATVDVLNDVRKIAALAVAAMEQFGAPKR